MSPTDAAHDPPSELLPSEHARFDEVCRFGQDQLESIATTIAMGFADDPVFKWIFGVDGPLPVEQGLILARMIVAETTPIDETHGFRDHACVALWRAPSRLVTPETEAFKGDRYLAFTRAFVEANHDRIAITSEFGDALHAQRPAEEHWYLSTFATRPERQSQGLGGRVMATMLDRSDRLGIATYLESSNPRNHGFYRRHGYEELGEFSAAGSPPLMRFFRQPRS